MLSSDKFELIKQNLEVIILLLLFKNNNNVALLYSPFGYV